MLNAVAIMGVVLICLEGAARVWRLWRALAGGWARL
jgi:hypothetical protein